MLSIALPEIHDPARYALFFDFDGTLVLITSSITVVLAWASLKMNQFSRFKVFQACTLALALTFVGIKSFEYSDKWTHYDIRFKNEAAAKKTFEAAYGANYLDVAQTIFHVRYGAGMPFSDILGVPFTGHFEKRYIPAREVAGTKQEGKYIEGNPMFFNSTKLFNPKEPVEHIMFIADPPPQTAHHGETAEHAGHGGHGPPVKVETAEIARFSAYVPSHSTYFSIYFTLTALHALHVIAGAIVIGYLWGPGSKMWQTDPERFTNRIEVSGLFWHFVDLVWIFLFPVLYLL